MAWQQLADTFTYDPFEAAGPAQVSMQTGMAKAKAEQQDVAAYNQALGQQQSAIVGGLTGLASIALAPVAAPALFGGLAAGAAGLGLGTAGTASTMGSGLAGSLFNVGASRVGSGLVAGAGAGAARSIYGR